MRRRWSVAWICCFINFLLLGVSRLSALLYLASISRYGVDRSRASLPFVLCYAVRNVSGPLIGYLGRKVEIRLLIACGCFISAIGAGICFYAEDIVTVTILWGGVHGFGFGLGTILLPQVLNQHFEKYIANANGIAFGGECVAGFVLPVIVELFLDTYGTSGTFLILSGLLLHGVPAALLLKSPKSSGRKETKDFENGASENSTSSNLIYNESFSSEDNLSSKCGDNDSRAECSQTQFGNLDQSCYSKCELAPEYIVEINPSDHQIFTNCSNTFHSNTKYSIVQKADRNTLEHSRDCDMKEVDAENPDETENCEKCLIRSQKYSIVPKQDQNLPIRRSIDQGSNHQIQYSNCEIQNRTKPKPTDNSTKRSSSFRVFLDPPFLLILLTQSSMIFIFTTVMTVIVDFARDAGVSKDQEVYVLVCLSVSDMLGRFGLGWVTDCKFMSNVCFSALCYAGTGFVMVGMVFLRGFPLTMAVAFFIGLFLGGLLIVGPGIVMDHIQEDHVPMALASRFVLFAPMCLTQSSLIGYFRETLGSYNGLFYILAFNCFLCCVFSLSVPCAAKLRFKNISKISSRTQDDT